MGNHTNHFTQTKYRSQISSHQSVSANSEPTFARLKDASGLLHIRSLREAFCLVL